MPKYSPEIWSPITGFDLYEISTLGRVRNVGGSYRHRCRVLCGSKYNSGHRHVTLCQHGLQRRQYIHRLVLETFVGPCPKGQECRHLNGDPSDNQLCNLKWGTKTEQWEDMILHKVAPLGARSGHSKLSEEQIRAIRTDKRRQRVIAAEYGVHQVTIHKIKCRKTWAHLES